MSIPRGSSRNINAEILERIIAHGIDLDHYSNYEVRRIVSFLNGTMEPEIVRQLQKYAGKDWTVRRLTALRAAVHAIISAGYRQMRSDVKADLRELARIESQWNKAMLSGLVPVEVSLVAPPLAVLRGMIRQAAIDGRFVSEWLGDLEPATLARVNRALMIGVTMGEGVDQIVRRIAGTRANQYRDGVLERSRRDLEAIVRTAVSGVSNNVRHETYRASRQVIKAVMFVATLDTATCIVCGHLDGNTYDIDEGPRPPIHGNCRCTTSPVLKSWQELGIALREASAGTRASMDGQVPATVKFGDWLRRRSAAEQDRILGQTRGRLYRSGQVRFRDFVDARDNTRLLTLAQLEQRL
jgi:SPP1 gp7 family putative phage head morphogenesis protein